MEPDYAICFLMDNKDQSNAIRALQIFTTQVHSEVQEKENRRMLLICAEDTHRVDCN